VTDNQNAASDKAESPSSVPPLDQIMPVRPRNPGKQPAAGLAYDEARRKLAKQVYPQILRLEGRVGELEAAQEESGRRETSLENANRELRMENIRQFNQLAEAGRTTQALVKLFTDIRAIMGSEITPVQSTMLGGLGQYKDENGFTYVPDGNYLVVRHPASRDTARIAVNWDNPASPIDSSGLDQLMGFKARCTDTTVALPKRFARRPQPPKDIREALRKEFMRNAELRPPVDPSSLDMVALFIEEEGR
jgi:hypothetical protein